MASIWACGPPRASYNYADQRIIMATRNGRHAKIRELVTKRHVASQEQLARLLAAEGIPVTQSTLSRDIRILGLVKVRGSYQAASELGPAPDQMRRRLQELVVRTSHAGNIVVLKTAPGNAHSLGVALDSAEWPEVLGTVAGDDTVFVVVRRPRLARKVVRRIEELQP